MNSTARTHYWQQHIEHWRDTGLSDAAFCKQQSLSYHQFVYWRRKLEGTDGATDTRDRGQSNNSKLSSRGDREIGV
jgi:hypothetical protein